MNLQPSPNFACSSNQLAVLNCPPEQIVSAILKVNIPNYVPSDILLRTRFNNLIFSAQFTVAQLSLVENDPYVESVEISKKMSPLKL